MKLKQKILYHISVIGLAAVVVVPFQASAFSADQAAGRAPSRPISAPVSRPLLSVAPASPQPGVRVSALSDCAAVARSSSSNLVQDSALIDLNQAASCFRLSLGSGARNRIAAVGLPVAPHEIAVAAAPILAAERVSAQAPVPDFSRSLGAYPAIGISTILAGAAAVRRQKQRPPSNRHDLIIVPQFQILRC